MMTHFLSLTAIPAIISVQLLTVGTAHPSSLQGQVSRVLESQGTADPIGHLDLVASTASGVARANLDLPPRVAEQAPVVEALERIRTFRSWGPDWDGEGSPAPKRATLDAASVLIGLLDIVLPTTPRATLNSLGEPMFIMLRDDFEFSATITSKNRVAFYIRTMGLEEAGVANFDHARLPSRIAQSLSKLVGQTA